MRKDNGKNGKKGKKGKKGTNVAGSGTRGAVGMSTCSSSLRSYIADEQTHDFLEQLDGFRCR